MTRKEAIIDLEIETHPERPYDFLRVKLPVPHGVFRPKNLWRYWRALFREGFLVWRSVLDVAIEVLEEPKEKPHPKAERIEIE
jgi:hypothetical protein